MAPICGRCIATSRTRRATPRWRWIGSRAFGGTKNVGGPRQPRDGDEARRSSERCDPTSINVEFVFPKPRPEDTEIERPRLLPQPAPARDDVLDLTASPPTSMPIVPPKCNGGSWMD